jgi:hypothetical protein
MGNLIDGVDLDAVRKTMRETEDKIISDMVQNSKRRTVKRDQLIKIFSNLIRDLADKPEFEIPNQGNSIRFRQYDRMSFGGADQLGLIDITVQF